jgi:hypothetical protein
MYWWILVCYPEPVAFNYPVIVLSIDRRAEYYGRNDFGKPSSAFL